MHPFFVASSLLCLVVCSSCSQMYEGFRLYSENRCYSQPYPEQQQCLEQVEGSYNRYLQDRKAALPVEKRDEIENEEKPLTF